MLVYINHSYFLSTLNACTVTCNSLESTPAAQVDQDTMVMFLAAFAVGATSLVYMYFKGISGSKPFHVDGPEAMKMKVLGFNIFPIICWLMGLLPDQTRKNLVTKEVSLSS